MAGGQATECLTYSQQAGYLRRYNIEHMFRY